MIFLLLLAALSAFATIVFSVLPPGTFLAVPAAATTAVTSAGGYAAWAIGLAGTSVSAAVTTIIPIWLGIEVAVLLWHVVTRWRPPFTRRLLK